MAACVAVVVCAAGGASALVAAPAAAGAVDVVYGVTDPRFAVLWPQMAVNVSPLGSMQVGVWLNYDCGNPTWQLPASQPLLVTLRAGCSWPRPGAYAAAARALVAAHPNIRELQVMNEPDLFWMPRTGELYSYLDLLAATHKALEGPV